MENTNNANKEFDIDKFNINLAESIESMQDTCDYIQKCNEPKTMGEIANEMDKIEKDMEWDKMCAIERKVDSLNDKMDLILQKLGDK